MIQSMTGFGSSSCQINGTLVSVEVRTVNHRFLDLHLRLPKNYSSLENRIQQVVRSVIRRGRVDIAVNLKNAYKDDFLIDLNAARSYLEAAEKLKDEFQIAGSLEVQTLLALPGTVQSRDAALAKNGRPDEDVSNAVVRTLGQALDDVAGMRGREGKALMDDLLQHLGSIRKGAKTIRTLAPTVVREYQKRLEERLERSLSDNNLDPQRIAQEVALFAEKCDITEELTRLESHLDQFAGWTNTDSEVGKKLDFLLQEMQREINTVLSKTSNLEITNTGIAFKVGIEKLREQVQNVE